jgi:valyl-tRNA synthetase
VLEATLRLAHPLIPFITEDIWQRVKLLAGQKGETIVHAAYPIADPSKIDHQAINDLEWVKSVIIGVRKIRDEMSIAPSAELPLYFVGGSDVDKQRLTDNHQFLVKLAKLSNTHWLELGDEAPMSSTALVGKMEIHVPMAGFIDKAAEVARLDKDIAKRSGEIQQLKGKLGNANFVDKAPQAVVLKEQDRLAATQLAVEKLERQVEKIKAL